MTHFADATLDSVTKQMTGRYVVEIERGPVSAFAAAITSEDAVYTRRDVARNRGLADIAAPPTFAFSALPFWGTFPDDQPADGGSDDAAVEAVRALVADGGLMLHAEEDLVFHRPLVVGDRLSRYGTIIGQHEKSGRNGTLTFLVIRNEHRDPDGQLVLTATTTLVHRPPKGT